MKNPPLFPEGPILFFSLILGLIEYQLTLLSVLFVLGSFSENVSFLGIQAGLGKLAALGLVFGMTGLAHLGLSHLFIKKDTFEGTINFKLTSSEQAKKIAILILTLFVVLCIANSILSYMRQVEIREGEIAMGSGEGGSGMSPLVVGVLTFVTSIGTGMLFFFGFYPALLMFVGILTKISIAVLSIILFFSIPRKKKLEYKEEAPDKKAELHKKENRINNKQLKGKRNRIISTMIMLLLSSAFILANDVVVVVFDMSGSFKSEFQNAKNSLVKLISELEPPCSMSGITICEDSFKDTASFINFNLPAAGNPIEKRKARYINFIKNNKETAIQKIQEMSFLESRATDVYGAFFAASRILKHTMGDQKFLIIYSDMLHNIKKELSPVDYRDTRVLCLFFRVENSEKDFLARLNYWNTYFQKCNCSSVEILEPTLSINYGFVDFLKRKGINR